MNTFNLAYQLTQQSGKCDAVRLERARDLLLDQRTVILPDNRIDFPSESEGFRLLPLAEASGRIRFCDCPDRRKRHVACKHDYARWLLWKAAHLHHTGRVFVK